MRIKTKKKRFEAALKAGVNSCMAGNMGVNTHSNKAFEIELMV